MLASWALLSGITIILDTLANKVSSRFGLLSPNASQTEPLQDWNHWKVFKRRENLNKLILTEKQLQFVTEHTVDEDKK